MPYCTEYRPAEVFTAHNGVTIYHVYKDNDPDQGTREYWFDTQADSRDEGGFDVRDLAGALGQTYEVDKLDGAGEEELKESIIRSAIDAGLLTVSG
jgi:hypothetical protein